LKDPKKRKEYVKKMPKPFGYDDEYDENDRLKLEIEQLKNLL